MRPDLWSRVEDIFHQLMEAPPETREEKLRKLAGRDDQKDVRLALERLLRADAQSDAWDEDFELFPARSADRWIGRRLGVYRVVEHIADGGMGVVYRASRDDGLFDHDVAIKVLRTVDTSKDMLRRFAFERRALATLKHPNIAHLLDGGTADVGSPYLVMELIEGEALDRHALSARLTVDERLSLFVLISRAVQYAHQNLIVHRDLKPSNILVNADGQPKLLDFGIARLLRDDGDDSTRTITSRRILTPVYASPEQFAGEPITTASDIYSLGVLLFELLTGDSPFPGTHSPTEWSRVVAEETPRKPSETVATASSRKAGPEQENPEQESPAHFASSCRSSTSRLARRLRGDLDRIILTALRKEPDRRYSSAGQLADDIERFRKGMPVLARNDTLGYRVSKFVRRNRLVTALIGVIALALFGGIAATTHLARIAQVDRDAARESEQQAHRDADHAAIEAASFRQLSEFLVDAYLGAGLLKHDDQRAAAARAIQRQAERVRATHPGEPHLHANLLDALARVCIKLSMYEDADQLITEAMEIRVTAFGKNSLEHALSLSSLGLLRFDQGRPHEAAALFARALTLHQELPVGAHTDVAVNANDLGCALRQSGDMAGATRYHELALALRRERSAEDSLAVAMSLNNLAGIHLDLGRFDQATVCFEEALLIRRETLGPTDPWTLQSLTNLSIPRFRAGDPGAAERMLIEAIEGYRQLGDEDPDGLAYALSNLGGMLIEIDRTAEAEKHLTEAADTLLALLGKDHPRVAATRSRASAAMMLQGRTSEALEQQIEVLSILRTAGEQGHAAIPDALWIQGACQLRAGALEEAHESLREALLLATPDSPRRQTYARMDAIVLNQLGRPDEANALSREIDDQLRPTEK